MLIDTAIFASMLGICFCFERLERWLEHHRPHHVQAPEEQQQRKRHYTVWVMAFGSNPAVMNAAHEFVVHVVFYSGRIFPLH